MRMPATVLAGMYPAEGVGDGETAIAREHRFDAADEGVRRAVIAVLNCETGLGADQELAEFQRRIRGDEIGRHG